MKRVLFICICAVGMTLSSGTRASAQAVGSDIESADTLYRECQSALSNSVNFLDTGVCYGTVFTTWGVLMRLRPLWEFVDRLPPLPTEHLTEEQHVQVAAAALSRVSLILGLGGVGPPACIPESANLHTITMVVVKYGQDHPEKLAKKAYDFAAEAIADAFKCPASLGASNADH